VAIDLVGTDRGHEEDTFLAQIPDEEREEVPGGRIRPLEVLDDEDQRTDVREPLEDAEHELEEAHLREAIVARVPRNAIVPRVVRPLGSKSIGTPTDLRHQPCQLASARSKQGGQRARIDLPEQDAEGLDEWGVWQTAGPERETAAHEDAATRGRDSTAERLDQTRLPDAGLAGDDDHP
jgi:hypothetical protein